MCMWIMHDIRARDDRKLKKLEAHEGGLGYGYFWIIVEELAKDEDNRLDYDDKLIYSLVKAKTKRERECAKRVVDSYGLFIKTDDGTQFYNKRVLSNMNLATKDTARGKGLRRTLSDAEYEQRVSAGKRSASKRKPSGDATENERNTNGEPTKLNGDTTENERNTNGEPTKLGEYKGENKIENKTKDKDEGIGAKPQRRFVPPTLEEARAYFEETGLHSDPERFHDYYTSNGWRVGKNPMKDWRATARNWEKNQFDHRPSTSSDSVRGERLIRGDDGMEKVRDARW